jgi:hypothetical protein
MIRLHFVVEGKTELRFVQNVLSPHLESLGIGAYPQIVLFGTHGDETFRGGLKAYAKPRKHILDWMKQDQSPDAFFTTLFDLYRLPADFPGYTQSRHIKEPYQKVELLEIAFAQDIQEQRFIPYIQLHEFEALLFADVRHFDWEFLEHESQIQELQKIIDKFENPELINEGESTAPSKRIIKLISEYESRKSSAGPAIAKAIGLERLREKCSHFNQWLTRLEQLSLLP